MSSLQELIGYSFQEPSLLTQALTHSSLGGEANIEHNQRLEFLGDAVLQLVMSERLYKDFPKLQEGALSRLRARSVQEASLYGAAQRINLGEHLRLSHGETQSGGREKPSILADAMEALIGAVYLDGGLESARRFVTAHLPTTLDEARRDYKTELQEKLQKGGRSAPHYHVLSEEGPPHARSFIAEAVWEQKQIGVGSGSSKKSAEQEAARLALANVQMILRGAATATKDNMGEK